MAIWLGVHGGMRLKRSASDESLFTTLQPADVDEGASRFSADRINGALITGDLVSFARVNENGEYTTGELLFVDPSGWDDNARHPDGQWYVNVDPIGGVRLYQYWDESIEGKQSKALKLSTIAQDIRIKLTLVEGEERCLAQTVSWSLNNDRETADVTPLGEGFRKNHATLVSGSGNLECIFDAGGNACDENANKEQSVYLHQ